MNFFLPIVIDIQQIKHHKNVENKSDKRAIGRYTLPSVEANSMSSSSPIKNGWPAAWWTG